MAFARPTALWLLLMMPIIAVMVIFSWVIYKRFISAQAARNFLFKSKLPSIKGRFFGAAVLLIGLAAAIIGLADPYYLMPVTKKIYRNVRIIFCLDVSRSMAFAEDIKPNRLAAAKEEIKDAYNSLEGIYEVGLIPFAGDPNLFYAPISSSGKIFLTMLAEADAETVFSQGSDLLGVFEGLNFIANNKSFPKEGINLAIILSDGGKEEGFFVDKTQLAKSVGLLQKKNFKVYTIGVGLSSPTPLMDRDFEGNFRGFWTNRETQQIYYSELDDDILKQIAQWGNGEYFPFFERGKLKQIITDIILANRILDKEKIKYEPLFIKHWLFALAAVMIWASFMINKKIWR